MRASNGHRVSWVKWDDGALPEALTGNGDWFTNNHLIPATEALRDALFAIETGQRVRIEGFLVDVHAPDMLAWTSSTRRDDTWCEIILVTGLSIIDIPTTDGP